MALPSIPFASSSLLSPNPPPSSLPWQNRGNGFHGSLLRDGFKRRLPTILCVEREHSDVKVNVSRKELILLSLVAFGSFPGCSAAYGKVNKTKTIFDEKRLLEQNRRIQEANNAPPDFPNFIREGFQVNVVTPEQYITSDSGLIYLDLVVGKGDSPQPGQQVTFHYIGYNESGRRIDSSYAQGSPARIRIATNALVPGFEEGIRSMRPGGKRRIIIPPELGPPVGPSTFFSSKQFEVFDIELLSVQTCQRRTIGFYSDLVCN